VHGVLFDLGLSLDQIKTGVKGLSFGKSDPLDMRLGQTKLTARDIVNYWSAEEIALLLENAAQERFAQKIAQKIVLERSKTAIETTDQLVAIIKQAVPSSYLKRKIHCATKTFLALRIAVNDELNNLKKALPQALSVLEPNQCLAVISFHSTEDKIVKNFIKEEARNNKVKILTKKPVTSLREEIKNNPRSRSAKLRVCQKI
jgi:16S rRNA (cytosine1402-N4)-methyltransferase